MGSHGAEAAVAAAAAESLTLPSVAATGASADTSGAVGPRRVGGDGAGIGGIIAAGAAAYSKGASMAVSTASAGAAPAGMAGAFEEERYGDGVMISDAHEVVGELFVGGGGGKPALAGVSVGGDGGGVARSLAYDASDYPAQGADPGGSEFVALSSGDQGVDDQGGAELEPPMVGVAADDGAIAVAVSDGHVVPGYGQLYKTEDHDALLEQRHAMAAAHAAAAAAAVTAATSSASAASASTAAARAAALEAARRRGRPGGSGTQLSSICHHNKRRSQ
ncbi:hypothetical protein HK405_001357, partial [Cladochytrium tenue]